MATELKQPETGLGSVEETNRLLQEASKQTGLAAPTFSPTGAITTKTLEGGEQPLQVPDTKVSTEAEGLSAVASSVAEQTDAETKAIQEQEKVKAEAIATAQKGEQDTRSLIQRALRIKASAAEAEKQQGIPEAQTTLGEARKQVTPAFNALISSQRAQQAELKALEGAGLTDVQRGARAREINRKYAFEQADLSLNLLVARQGVEAATIDLQTAQNIVDRKIALELEPIQFELDYTKDFVDRNRDILDREDKRLFDLRVNELEGERDERKTVATLKGNLAMQFMQNGRSIPPYYQQRLNKVTTQEEYNQVLSEMARDGVSLAKPEKPKGTTIALTTEDRRTLLGSGLTSNSITQIESDIQKFGIDAVLEGIDDPKQKSAIQKVYGGEEPTKLNRESIATLYGLDETQTRTGFLGFGKTNKAKLDEIMDTISKYQVVGYSDAEILKLIQKAK